MPRWTPAQLKVAYLALSPAPATLEDAAATLNAQTTSQATAVPITEVAAYLGLSGKLGGILAFAQSPPSGASASAISAAEGLAFMLEHPQTFPSFDMANPIIAGALTSMLAALVSPGSGVTAPLDSTDQATLLALGSETVPTWQPPVTVGDLQTALNLVA